MNTAANWTEPARMLLSLPAMMMRGGTSRGMFFVASDLARTGADLDTLLPALMGSPGQGQVDGVGGGSSTTSKVAIVSPSEADDCDVDYLFAQVSPDAVHVDWAPTCGNVLAGVGPFAIERAMVTPTGETTTVRVRMVNTGARADCVVATPGGSIAYDATPGDRSSGSALSPATRVAMTFRDYLGGTTGTLFPTGSPHEVIDGVEITAIDASVCAVIARAADLGITGAESAAEINANTLLLKRIAELRLKAGEAMGMGDVAGSVLPKVMLVSEGTDGADITSRYFVPATCHPAHAVSGAVCLATASAMAGTIPASVAADGSDRTRPHAFSVAHPSGRVGVELDPRHGVSARIHRTARKLFDGQVFATLRRIAC